MKTLYELKVVIGSPAFFNGWKESSFNINVSSEFALYEAPEICREAFPNHPELQGNYNCSIVNEIQRCVVFPASVASPSGVVIIIGQLT